MQLAATCSSCSVKDLEVLYRLEASNDAFTVDHGVPPEEAFEDVENMENEAASNAQDATDRNHMKSVLDQIRQTTADSLRDGGEDVDLAEETVQDPDMQLPDGAQLIELTDAPVQSPSDGAGDGAGEWQLPQTLTDALPLVLCRDQWSFRG